MIRLYSSVVLVWVLLPVCLSFAQAKSESFKFYSGFLHQAQKVEAKQDRQCLIEFKSPVSFLKQGTGDLPEQLTYTIRFRNDTGNIYAPTIIEKGVFEDFIIKIYTTDDQVYPIDPDAEGDHKGFIGEQHIIDKRLIGLIMGKDIDHIEVVSPSVHDDQGKYILDKMVIYDN